MHILVWEMAALAVYFLYCSYFEWFFHRYLCHVPKYISHTFRAHTLVLHQVYKADLSYT